MCVIFTHTVSRMKSACELNVFWIFVKGFLHLHLIKFVNLF